MIERLMDDFRRRDAVLRLLPEDVPDAFLRLEPADQARRGRLWITCYGLGMEQAHAWWFVLSPEDKIAPSLADVALVPDEHYPAMLQGRLKFEQGKTMVGPAVQ